MMNSEREVIITKQTARRIAIRQSGLNKRSPFGRGKNAVYKALDHLGYIQIDTISVVERAHHHNLWNRVSNHEKKYLHILQFRDKKVLEYWAHAASYLPMKDFRYTLIMKQFFKDQKDRWPKPDKSIMNRVFEQVKSEGTMMARDFEHRQTPGGGWWDWKPAKWALERLFLEGDLVIRERKGFQKVYDIPENVIPADIDVSFPSLDAHARYLIRRCLQAFGIATLNEMYYLRKGMGPHVKKNVDEMLKEGELMKVQIKGLNNQYFSFPGKDQFTGIRIAKNVRILSPFDNLIIQRKRTKEIFGFDYQIECYVPRPKRKYGYFTLPLLYGDQFIGRMDSKANRKTKCYHIFNLVIEDEVKIDDRMLEELVKSIWEFTGFNGCVEVDIGRVEPADMKNEIELRIKDFE